MLDNLFKKPIELEIGNQILKFYSIDEFEFCLNGRTSVPSKKITQIFKFSADELKKEARTIKDIEKKFVSILSRSIEDPSSINRGLKEIDPTVFSQDHNWREIIAALNRAGEELNPYRRVALVKYMQYLASRQDIIKYFYSDKSRPSTRTGVSTQDQDAARAKLTPEETDNFRDTLILDGTIVDTIQGRANAKAGLERMPKGEIINVVLSPGKSIDVLLSKHKCKLGLNDGFHFIDQAGNQYELHKGRNVIGRDAVSDIRLDSSLRDISRFHLLIENVGDNCVQLTDMSSHGTYIPDTFLESITTA